MKSEEGVSIAYNDDGLVPVVAQEVESDTVLMVAYASPEAVAATRDTGYAHYFSRSRDALWKKGETSGHLQRVEEIRIDCDGDALLYRVDQHGAACHTGYQTCFHRTIDGESIGTRVFDPSDVYD